MTLLPLNILYVFLYSQILTDVTPTIVRYFVIRVRSASVMDSTIIRVFVRLDTQEKDVILVSLNQEKYKKKFKELCWYCKSRLFLIVCYMGLDD